jgi:hypothetical protein
LGIHILFCGGGNIKVAIHQPNHWPFLGFFHKIASADLFVLFDTAQFADGDFHHRNRIRTPSSQGFGWLTVPVVKQKKPLQEIQIQNDIQIKKTSWNDNHRTIIDSHYHNAPEYSRHQEFLDHLYTRQWMYLFDMNFSIIEYLLKVFQISTPIIKSSALSCEQEGSNPMAVDSTYPALPEPPVMQGIRQRATWRIIQICKEVGADTYLSGPSGRDYMDLSLFKKAGIAVDFQEFRHPGYPQMFTPFVSNLAALDYILNVDISDACHRELITISTTASQTTHQEA